LNEKTLDELLKAVKGLQERQNKGWWPSGKALPARGFDGRADRVAAGKARIAPYYGFICVTCITCGIYPKDVIE